MKETVILHQLSTPFQKNFWSLPQGVWKVFLLTSIYVYIERERPQEVFGLSLIVSWCAEG